MPIRINQGKAENLIHVHVSGELSKADYIQFVPEFERLVSLKGQLHVLFEMTHFDGWDAAALWQDIKFDFKHFCDIERLAIVGEKEWQRILATSCNSLMEARVRYFDHADAAKGREWLTDKRQSHSRHILSSS